MGKRKRVYRRKVIKSGALLEVEMFPVWKIGKGRKKKTQVTSEMSQLINRKNTRKNIIRTIMENFKKDDLHITLKYRNGEVPESLAEAKRDIKNYIRRLKDYCKKNGLPNFKYFYVTAQGENGRWHHHVIMNFHDRNVAEDKWTKGKAPWTKRIKENSRYLSVVARYFAKHFDKDKDCEQEFEKGAKRYGYSLNLKKPWLKPEYSNTKITRSKAHCIATGRGKTEPQDYINQEYPDYIVLRTEIIKSEFNDEFYIYITARKKE